MELATFTEHMLLNWWLLLLVCWKALRVGYFSKRKTNSLPKGISGGPLSSPLGSGETVGGSIAILAVGWWIALAIASARRARAAARARPWRAPLDCLSISTCGLVAMMPAPHAEGCQFNPDQVQMFNNMCIPIMF